MKKWIILFIAIIGSRHMAQSQNPMGIFDDHVDVGNPRLKGNMSYDPVTQQYTLEGAGSNMWTNIDQFHFAYKKIKGDFIISASIRFLGKGVDAHRKIGIIARDKLTTDSRYADACVHGDGLSSLQYRSEDGAITEQAIL